MVGDSAEKTVLFIIKNGGRSRSYKDKRLPRPDKSGLAMTPNAIINHYMNRVGAPKRTLSRLGNPLSI